MNKITIFEIIWVALGWVVGILGLFKISPLMGESRYGRWLRFQSLNPFSSQWEQEILIEDQPLFRRCRLWVKLYFAYAFLTIALGSLAWLHRADLTSAMSGYVH